MAKIQTKSLYELWGIVCHSGVSLESGQLYCYTKRSTGLMLSDEQVKVVTRAKSMGVQLQQDPKLGKKHLLKSVTSEQIGVPKEEMDDDLEMEGGGQ